MNQIPFNHFKKHYEQISAEVLNATQKVLESGWYILGTEVQKFEKAFADYTGAEYCVSVANGTEAIALALMAAGIKPGDEVITTALTAYPTITAINMVGAVPVAADTFENGLINPESVKRLISAKTKAVIPVHLYGQVCSSQPLLEITKENNLCLIEDCAQSAGAREGDQHCGTFGAMGCFSFYPTKNLGAFGDAGAVITRDAELAQALKSLRNYGQTDRYKHDSAGINSRMDEMQAAILNVKLSYLDSWNARRRDIAKAYTEALPQELLWERSSPGDVFHLFPLVVNDRNNFMKSMDENGVKTLIHYPIPVYKQEAFKGRADDCHVVERLCETLVSIPLNPELTDSEVEQIIAAVQKAVS